MFLNAKRTGPGSRARTALSQGAGTGAGDGTAAGADATVEGCDVAKGVSPRAHGAEEMDEAAAGAWDGSGDGVREDSREGKGEVVAEAPGDGMGEVDMYLSQLCT